MNTFPSLRRDSSRTTVDSWTCASDRIRDRYRRIYDGTEAAESLCGLTGSAGVQSFEVLDAGGDITVLGVDAKHLREELERLALLSGFGKEFGQVVA